MSTGPQKHLASTRISSFKNSSGKQNETGKIKPDISRVVSLQKIAIKSKGKVEQITEKYGRNSEVESKSSGNRKQLLTRRPRTQATHSTKMQKSRFMAAANENTDPDRPVTVGLPYISSRKDSFGSVKSGHSHNRCKSSLAGSRAPPEVSKINMPTRVALGGECTGRPRADTETRKYIEYPVDKDERENVEHQYASSQLCPVSYTYMLMLEENPQTCMELRNHGLSTNSLSVMSNSLENNNIVKELDLEGNVLNDIAIEDLGILLRGNANIEHLNLSSNTFSSKGIIAIGNLLDANKTLSSLSLSRNKLTDTDVELLCSSLEDSNNNLKKLDLSFNNFTPEVGETIGRHLAISNRLQELNIAGNNLGPIGMSPIFEGLKRNNSLKVLDASCNEVSDNGIEILADMNALGRKMKHLDLSDNFITVQGLRHFMPSLSGNDSLVVLKLDNNQIGTNGLIFILKSLLRQSNVSLSQLHARGVFADQTTRELCNKIRTRNSNFVLFGVTGNTGDGSSDCLKILEIYLSKNKLLDADWSEQIDSVFDAQI